MPYCPNCLTEYVEGTSTCDDCGAYLLPGSPPAAPARPPSEASDNSKLVTVRVFIGNTALVDVDLARNILQSQGIPSLVSGEYAAELLPVLQIPLLVREEDAERAAAILRGYLDGEASPAG
jgi:hypothetical protein